MRLFKLLVNSRSANRTLSASQSEKSVTADSANHCWRPSLVFCAMRVRLLVLITSWPLKGKCLQSKRTNMQRGSDEQITCRTDSISFMSLSFWPVWPVWRPLKPPNLTFWTPCGKFPTANFLLVSLSSCWPCWPKLRPWDANWREPFPFRWPLLNALPTVLSISGRRTIRESQSFFTRQVLWWIFDGSKCYRLNKKSVSHWYLQFVAKDCHWRIKVVNVLIVTEAKNNDNMFYESTETSRESTSGK